VVHDRHPFFLPIKKWATHITVQQSCDTTTKIPRRQKNPHIHALPFNETIRHCLIVQFVIGRSRQSRRIPFLPYISSDSLVPLSAGFAFYPEYRAYIHWKGHIAAISISKDSIREYEQTGPPLQYNDKIGIAGYMAIIGCKWKNDTAQGEKGI